MTSNLFSPDFYQADFAIGLLTGLLLALLIALVRCLLRRPSARFEAFSTDAGTILISRRALAEQIERCCEELDDVGRCRVEVFKKKDLIETRIQMRLRTDSQLVGVSGYLQEQVDHVVRKTLGIEKVGPINIIITGILPASSEKATSLKTD